MVFLSRLLNGMYGGPHLRRPKLTETHPTITPLKGPPATRDTQRMQINRPTDRTDFLDAHDSMRTVDADAKLLTQGTGLQQRSESILYIKAINNRVYRASHPQPRFSALSKATNSLHSTCLKISNRQSPSPSHHQPSPFPQQQ